MRYPDSNATKHHLTPLQRQYVESRITEIIESIVSPLREEVADLSVENIELRAKLSLANARIQKLEMRADDDDKNSLTKSKLVRLMKAHNIYDGDD